MLLSIILPTYNTDSVLFQRCVSSLVAQLGISWDDIELIIVDDGNDFQDYNNYFNNSNLSYKIFHTQHNVGPGLARQYGIDRSNGEWIYFMDSDDELASPYSLCYIIESIKASPNKHMFTFHAIDECENNKIVNYKMGSLYCTCMRRDKLQEYDIRFIPTYLYEDVAFISSFVYLVGFDAIQDCDAFPIYYYHKNENSITHGCDYQDLAKNRLIYDLQNFIYVDYKMQEFYKTERSFYVYSMFRLMIETKDIINYKVQGDKAVLALYANVIVKMKNILSGLPFDYVASIASKFGNRKDELIIYINEFLNDNPLLKVMGV